MLPAGDKGTERGLETSGCGPPPVQQGPRSSGGASLALVTELALALTTPVPAPGSAGCTGAAAGEVAVTARLLPKPLAGHPNCAWLPSSYRSLHFRKEARLGWGRYKKHRCCGFASSPFLVPAQSVPVTECPRGNPADHLVVRLRTVVHGHGRLRAPATSAQSAWRPCRTAPGRPATSWRRPRWRHSHRWALKEGESPGERGSARKGLARPPTSRKGIGHLPTEVTRETRSYARLSVLWGEEPLLRGQAEKWCKPPSGSSTQSNSFTLTPADRPRSRRAKPLCSMEALPPQPGFQVTSPSAPLSPLCPTYRIPSKLRSLQPPPETALHLTSMARPWRAPVKGGHSHPNSALPQILFALDSRPKESTPPPAVSAGAGAPHTRP